MNDTRKMTKCETIFAEELRLIHDNWVRGFVIDCFEKLCPDTFWTQFASSSGKYHPRISVGEGGLVRHTKLAVWWGLELSRALCLESSNDQTIAALLLHDLSKRHDNISTHGLEAAYLIREKINKNYDKITEGIARHMGRWTAGGEIVETHKEFCQLVHLADYCASRKADEKLAELGAET